MDTRIELIGIIVNNINSTEKLNTILHEYGQYIIVGWEYLIEQRMLR